ncbi:MAG: PAS domain-containing protein [Alphaproteobacteria bacterium]
MIEFLLPETRLFHDQWFALQRRSGAVVPARAEFNPAAIKSVQRYLGIAEITDEGELVYRFVGTGIEQLMGTSLTGTRFGDIIEARTRPVFKIWTRNLLEGHPYGIYFIFVASTATGAQVEVEDIAFPLADSQGRFRFVVGYGGPTRSLAYGESLAKLHDFRALRAVDIGCGLPESAQRLAVLK